MQVLHWSLEYRRCIGASDILENPRKGRCAYRSCRSISVRFALPPAIVIDKLMIWVIDVGIGIGFGIGVGVGIGAGVGVGVSIDQSS